MSVAAASALQMPPGNPPKPDQNQPATEPHGIVERVTRPYKPREIPPNSVANSNRIDSLMRAGNLYLSLEATMTPNRFGGAVKLDLELEIGPQP